MSEFNPYGLTDYQKLPHADRDAIRQARQLEELKIARDAASLDFLVSGVVEDIDKITTRADTQAFNGDLAGMPSSVTPLIDSGHVHDTKVSTLKRGLGKNDRVTRHAVLGHHNALGGNGSDPMSGNSRALIGGRREIEERTVLTPTNRVGVKNDTEVNADVEIVSGRVGVLGNDARITEERSAGGTQVTRELTVTPGGSLRVVQEVTREDGSKRTRSWGTPTKEKVKTSGMTPEELKQMEKAKRIAKRMIGTSRRRIVGAATNDELTREVKRRKGIADARKHARELNDKNIDTGNGYWRNEL